jgi:hypothetical protein
MNIICRIFRTKNKRKQKFEDEWIYVYEKVNYGLIVYLIGGIS